MHYITDPRSNLCRHTMSKQNGILGLGLRLPVTDEFSSEQLQMICLNMLCRGNSYLVCGTTTKTSLLFIYVSILIMRNSDVINCTVWGLDVILSIFVRNTCISYVFSLFAVFMQGNHYQYSNNILNFLKNIIIN